MNNSHISQIIPAKNWIIPMNYDGYLFNFDHGLWATGGGKIIYPQDTYVATFRPDSGKFGGAVAIDSSTTNVVTNTDLDTGWNKSYCTGIQWNDIDPPDGIDSPVVSFYDADTNQTGYWYSYGDYAPQVPGQTYTVSLYVKTRDSNFRINFYTADNSETGRYSSEYITVPNDGKWHRVVWNSFTNPENSQSDSLSFHFYFGNPQGESQRTWFCAPQMEAKSFPTSFTVGSRSTNGRLPYPNIAPNNWDHFTFACWCKTFTGTGYRMPAGAWSKWYFSWYSGTTNRLRVSWVENGSQRSMDTALMSDVNSLNWNHIGFTYDLSTTTCKIYANGKLRLERNDVVFNASPGVFGLGNISGTTTSYPLNGLLDDVVILDRVASEEEFAAWYHTNAPMIDPYTPIQVAL